MVKTEEICGLIEGDHYEGGKLIDKEGYEIPVVTPEEFEQIQTGTIEMPVPKIAKTSEH